MLSYHVLHDSAHLVVLLACAGMIVPMTSICDEQSNSACPGRERQGDYTRSPATKADMPGIVRTIYPYCILLASSNETAAKHLATDCHQIACKWHDHFMAVNEAHLRASHLACTMGFISTVTSQSFGCVMHDSIWTCRLIALDDWQ